MTPSADDVVDRAVEELSQLVGAAGASLAGIAEAFDAYRTRSKLTPEQADAIADRIDRHVRQLGFTNVRTIVFDACTDLRVERPASADTRMQHQAPRPAPIVTR